MVKVAGGGENEVGGEAAESAEATSSPSSGSRLQGLLGGPGQDAHQPIAPYVRDVDDHLHRTVTEVHTLDEPLDSVLGAQQARVGTWQNDDMRRISAWAAIPMMVTGVYGMKRRRPPPRPRGRGQVLAPCGHERRCGGKLPGMTQHADAKTRWGRHVGAHRP
ncbi:hypothetical protein ADK53_05280 [Streptomyces sp. WM6373]|nr:hypothetical protein ADK53_05280 [Streptomyces sp. WM6373]